MILFLIKGHIILKINYRNIMTNFQGILYVSGTLIYLYSK